MNNAAKKRFDVWKIVSISVLCLYGLFLLYPLFKLLYSAVLVDGQFSFNNFKTFISKAYYIQII